MVQLSVAEQDMQLYPSVALKMCKMSDLNTTFTQHLLSPLALSDVVHDISLYISGRLPSGGDANSVSAGQPTVGR